MENRESTQPNTQCNKNSVDGFKNLVLPNYDCLYLLMCKWLFSIFLVASMVSTVFLRVSNNAFMWKWSYWINKKEQEKLPQVENHSHYNFHPTLSCLILVVSINLSKGNPPMIVSACQTCLFKRNALHDFHWLSTTNTHREQMHFFKLQFIYFQCHE